MEEFLIRQFDISFLDVTAYVGLAAAGLMTLNLMLGLLVSVQYSPVKKWPRKRIPISRIHNWTGYSALFLSLAHPVWLLFAAASKFTLIDLLLPINMAHQPWQNTLGALALYSLLFVVVTAYFRQRFNYAFWKKLHYVSYAVLVLFLSHSILIDPTLDPAVPINYLDGGKLFVEACALLSIVAVGWRVSVGRQLRSRNARADAIAPHTLWSGPLRVAQISDEARQIKTFRLVDPGGAALPFAYAAGQYLTFRFKDAKRRFSRSYSLSSAPHDRMHCDITVRRIQGGLGSGYLHDSVQVGDLLDCVGPGGKFTFDHEVEKGLVLIGGGVGITPLMSMLRDLAAKDWVGDAFLVYAFRDAKDLAFGAELAAIATCHPRLKILLLPTNIEGSEWRGPHGFINASLLSNFIPRLPDKPVYLCGPAPMMTACRALLQQLGVADTQIRTEDFGGTPDLNDMAGLVDATVVFSREKITTQLSAGQTLLQAAEAAGVLIESSCRAGTCGTCKVHLVSGQVTMHRDDILSAKEMRDGTVLACQARCMTENVVLDTRANKSMRSQTEAVEPGTLSLTEN